MSVSQTSRSAIPAFLRDIRVLQVIGQLVFVFLLVAFVSQITTSIFLSLQAKNLTPTYTFLNSRAGFDISQHPEWYSSNSTYWQAFQVGIINTLRIVVIGLILTTIQGVFVGIFLLSNNWLVRNIARVYVEVLRNTPLLVQLYVWYFVIMLTLPPFQQPYTLPGEGVTLIPLRLLLYGAVLLFTWRWAHGRQVHGNAAWRQAVVYGLAAAFVAIEAAFWLPGTRGLYASSIVGYAPFLAYVVISLLLLAAAWFAPKELRLLALAVIAGQLVGGLLFYFGIAPTAGIRLEIYPAIYVSIRGFVFPSIMGTARLAEWLAFVGIGLALAIMLWLYFGRIIETTGRPIPRGWYAFLAIAGFALVGWMVVASEPAPALVPVQQDGAIVYLPLEDARTQNLLTEADKQLYSQQPILLNLPERKVNRAGILTGFAGGTEIPPEYMALLLGLVVYTSAFIAEIVRAGILAVPRGQIEASRALGLTTAQTLRMVILPQALRVIIPPLGNQYLNLSKNSSLGIAIAYADLFQVTTVIMNQSGQSVTGITMVMVTYLIISLTIAFGTNLVNRRFQLVTR